MPPPGIAPGLPAPQAGVLLLYYSGDCAGRESNPGLVRGRDVYYHCTTGAEVFVPRFERGISRVLGERHNQARPYEHGEAFNEDRTRDLALTKRMLCQLSYEGETRAVVRPAAPSLGET